MQAVYWIQKADFSHTDYDAVGVEEAIEAFRRHPWDQELELYSRLEEDGNESCDPGFGIVAPSGHILHVCPVGDGFAYYHYCFPETRRLLWLIPISSQGTVTRWNLSMEDVPTVIGRFFQRDHDWLIEHAPGDEDPQAPKR